MTEASKHSQRANPKVVEVDFSAGHQGQSRIGDNDRGAVLIEHPAANALRPQAGGISDSWTRVTGPPGNL